MSKINSKIILVSLTAFITNFLAILFMGKLAFFSLFNCLVYSAICAGIYICLIKITRKLFLSFITSMVAAFFPIFWMFSVTFSLLSFFTFLLFVACIFSYTMRDAQGLKHKQDMHFVIISAIFYVILLFITPYALLIFAIIAYYEFSKKIHLKKIIARMIIFEVITAVSIIKIIC
ncbi:MAG: hypothetical protein LBU55_03415 [Elusimicrobiota bacterium]|nr:hypothetical protein [Elusimicrobiota bacterium]